MTKQMSYLNYTNFTVIQVISAALNYDLKRGGYSLLGFTLIHSELLIGRYMAEALFNNAIRRSYD